MPIWPVTLPQQLLVKDYTETMADTSIRTSMESGPAKVRKRTSAAIRPVRGSLILTAAEVAIFKAFYITDLSGGALRFDWVDPITAAAVEMRFTETPGWSSQGNLFRVSLSLEIMP